MWQWAAEQDASHFLTLQDDARVAPNFWAALRAMVEAVPDDVIGLEAVHPAGPELARQGHRWYTTSDCVIGVAYVLPRTLLREFLAWRASALELGAIEAITEDTLIGLWCLATGRKVWHPLPTIVDHDTSIASTYANDAHESRRPLVRWDYGHTWALDEMEKAEFWGKNGPKPHIGRFYGPNIPMLAKRWVKIWTPSDHARVMLDDGEAELRGLRIRAMARDYRPSTTRVLICVPTQGGASGHREHVASLIRLAKMPFVTFDNAWEIFDAWTWEQDLVRVRSRFVRVFLEETTATHLLFVDKDVSFPPECVAGMLRCDRDIVCAPYPKRGRVHWERVAYAAAKPEAGAFEYSVRLSEGAGVLNPDATTEIAGTGLGMTLCKRSALERMVAHYQDDPELDYDDGPQKRRTCALFKLIVRNRELLPEDYSFFTRARDMGLAVHLYLGPGSPVDHWGDFKFAGHVEAFGLERKES